MAMHYENHRKSIAKCFTWRAVAFFDTLLLSLIFTGSIGNAFAISGVELFTKTTFYYLHERLWLSIARRRDAKHAVHAGSFSHTKVYSALKAMSWRMLGSVDTFFIALLVTGNFQISTSIGLVEVVTKSMLYYAHDRAWVRWGRTTQSQNVEAPYYRGILVTKPAPLV